MKYNVLAIMIIVFIVTANIYAYRQNERSSKEIENLEKACMLEHAELKRQYEKRINTLSMELKDLPDKAEMRQESIKSNLDNMASFGHMIRAVRHKYEFLLHSVQLSSNEKKQLLHLLTEREKLNGVTFQSLVETSEVERMGFLSRLASAEDNIKKLLNDPIDYDRYMYLKDRSL
jgi:hypothetical protein